MGIFIALMQQFTGISPVFVFSNIVFSEGIGDSDSDIPVILTTALGLVNLLFTLLSTGLVEKYGRKKLYIIGLLGVSLILLLFSIVSYADKPGNWATKIFLVLWPIPFSISCGALTFPYMSEILPDKAMSLAVLVNWGVNFLIV